MKQINGIIYKVTSPSGKIYIGQTTKTLEGRKKTHFKSALHSNQKDHNCKFHNAIRKYTDLLVWEILHQDIKSYDELNNLEIKTIQEYNAIDNGYNCTEGGLNGAKSEETKEKMRGSNNHNFGRMFSEKTIAKMSTAAIDRFKNPKNHPFYGRSHSEKTKFLLSESSKKQFSEPLAREFLSKLAKKRFQNPKAREQISTSKGCKPFSVYRKATGEYIGDWINQQECANVLKIHRQNIGKCLLKKYKSTGGYIFIHRI